MKRCRVCGQEKPLDDFHRNSRAKDGRQSRCKECGCRSAREWNEANRDRKRENGRRWREENADAINAKRRQSRAEDPERAGRQRQQHRESHARNREKVLAYQRQRQQDPAFRAKRREYMAQWLQVPENRERARANQLLRHYGVTRAQYDALLEEQGGVCAICGGQPATRGESKRPFRVDHCHETGVVRGLLCAPCNVGLSRFGDSPEVLLAAAAYLHRGMASINVTLDEKRLKATGKRPKT